MPVVTVIGKSNIPVYNYNKTCVLEKICVINQTDRMKPELRYINFPSIPNSNINPNQVQDQISALTLYNNSSWMVSFCLGVVPPQHHYLYCLSFEDWSQSQLTLGQRPAPTYRNKQSLTLNKFQINCIQRKPSTVWAKTWKCPWVLNLWGLNPKTFLFTAAFRCHLPWSLLLR